MYLEAHARAPQGTMGCGKSRMRSPQNSDNDLKKTNGSNNVKNKNSKNVGRIGSGKSGSGFGGNNKVSGGNPGNGGDGDTTGSEKDNSSRSQSQSSKRKKLFGGSTSIAGGGSSEGRPTSEIGEENLPAEKTSTTKRSHANGRSLRPRERKDEIGVPLNSGTDSSNDDGSQVNGFYRSQNKPYLLEVPNEISSVSSATTSQTKTTMKDFKSLTASKIVHVTKSQIEFFRMLDEKIERGQDYMTSENASEVSSIYEDDDRY